MRIYLIRHGEKTDNSRNHAALELTEKGFQQADAVGIRLRNHAALELAEKGFQQADAVGIRLRNLDSGVKIVTHGGVIRTAMCGILGIGQESRFQFSPPANCSITELHAGVSPDRFRIDRCNDAAHLEER